MGAVNSFADLVRRRPNAPRWPYVAPAVVALLFVGHAIEDAGPGGVVILRGLVAFCAVQALWRSILGWALLFGPFLGYGLVVAVSREGGPWDEWIILMLLGLGPALLLWLGRPWRSRASPWDIITRAEEMLLELERAKGISIHHIEFVATFEKWDDGMGVWIFFPTDADLREYSESGVTNRIEAEFRGMLKQLKYPFRKFPRVGFVFDSDENVQKNFEGSYFYRLR